MKYDIDLFVKISKVLLRKLKSKINSARLNFNSAIRKYRISRLLDPHNIMHLRRTLAFESKWYGSSYGGFYVLPGLLNNNSIVYSFGIGKDISFDVKIIKKHKCEVHGFDPTPKSINWIKEQKLPKEFNFHDYGISTKTGSIEFYLPANPKHTSGSLLNMGTVKKENKLIVHMKSLEQIAHELGHKHIDVLKMDIEGAEYEVIESLLNSSITIDQLLIEFHDRLFNDRGPKSRISVEILKKNGYEIFASSASYEEISFVHRRKIPILNLI